MTCPVLTTGEVFVVQWERVRLHGREAEGAYTFQAALHLTGTITFSYRDVRETYMHTNEPCSTRL